jgi:branched-chain amino acid transport system permease protein
MLFLPFRGLREALALFLVLLLVIPSLKILSQYIGKVKRLHLPGLPRVDRKVIYIPAFLVVVILPFLMRDYIIDIAVLTGIYIILAEGLNVVVGFTGLLHLGFVAFYAIGAYTYALITTRLGFTFWTALPFSLGLSTIAGFLLAFPALRLKGDYLAIVTLGFGEIVRLVLNNWDSLTRGPNGILGIPPPSIMGFSFARLHYYYYFVLAVAIIAVVVIRNIFASKVGRAWVAIREDETASAAMGINTMAYKLYSFGFGAFWAGLAGALYAAKMQFVSPESFNFMESVLVLCMVILGGIGSIPGVILGAVILVLLPEFLREVQLYRMLALGAGLVVLMIFRPQGLLGGRNVSLGD